MSKPALAMQTDRGRYYRNRNHDNQPLISVTTALKVLDKPALVPWAAKMVAEEFMAQLPAAVRASRSKGTREQFIKEIKGSPYAKRDAASNRGTEVHEAAEAHILGRPYKGDPSILPFVDQLIDAIEVLGIDFEASEATVANPEVGYAGTLDIISRCKAVDDGAGCWILDIKTGDASKAIDAVYLEYGLQLAALRRCTELWLPDHSILPMPNIDRAAVLNLRPNGWALVPVDEAKVEVAYKVYRACVLIAEVLPDLKSQFDPPHTSAERDNSPLVGAKS